MKQQYSILRAAIAGVLAFSILAVAGTTHAAEDGKEQERKEEDSEGSGHRVSPETWYLLMIASIRKLSSLSTEY